MAGLILFWTLTCVWAGKTAVPSVGDGHAVFEDPYVKEYRETMASVKSEMAAITAAMAAMPDATSLAGAIAAQVQLAATYAPVAGLMAKAEAAHTKMLKHLMGADASSDSEFHVMIGLPQFDQARKHSSAAPAQKPEDEQKPVLEAVRPDFIGPGTGLSFAPGGQVRDAVNSKPQQEQAKSETDQIVDGIRERMLERQAAVNRLLAGKK
jgi:hypothetical protein